MEVNKVENVINLYMLANNLKYINYDSNQSYADHLYGSMILLVAMNSEFDLTGDLGKVLRMIALSGIIDTNYNDKKKLEKLLKNSKYLKELEECEYQNSSDSLLALKLKMFDNKLHNLIETNKHKDLSFEELYEEAKNLDILKPNNNEDDTKLKEVLRFYYLNKKLKQKQRSGWDKTHWNVNYDHIERISEHVYGTIVLALSLDLEYNFNINIDKVIETLCIHEVGEILIGDITPFDNVTSKEKEQIEHQAVIKVMGNLNRNKMMTSLIFDFDKRQTSDMKFAYYCDKLEADIQAKIYQDMGCQRPLNEQENNVVLKSPKIQKMIEDGASTAFDIWYEWDKPIFIDNPILIKTLNYVKNNKLK